MNMSTSRQPKRKFQARTTPMREALTTQTGVLDAEACKYLITFFEKNINSLGAPDSNPAFSYRTIGLRDIAARKNEEHRIAAKFLNRARLKACSILRKRFALKKIYPEYTQIMAWPPNSSQTLHQDLARPTTTYAAIIYLNDDFTGGRTFFPTIPELVVPKMGMLLGYHGRNLVHGVSVVADGTRFTVACWFTDQSGHAE